MASGIPQSFEEAFKHAKRSVLGERIDVSNKLLNLLYDAEVISKEHRQDCEKGIDYERADKLMDILVKRPDNYFPLFCDALIKDGQRHVVSLMNPVPPLQQQQQQHFGVQPVFNAPNPVPANQQTQFYTAGSYTQYPANPPFMANYTSPLPYGNPGIVPGNQPQIWFSTAASGVPQTWNTAAYGASVPPAAYQTGSAAASYGGFGGSPQQNGGASVRSTTQTGVQPRAQTTPVAGQVQSNKSSVNQTGPASSTTGDQSSSDKAAAAAASGSAALSAEDNQTRTTNTQATNSVDSNQSSTSQTGPGSSAATRGQTSSSDKTAAAASVGPWIKATEFIPAELKLVPSSELTIIQELHSGGFGAINVASHAQYGTVVFKQLATKVINAKDKNAREMQREALAHRLRHKNIVQTIGAVFEPGHYGILLEYAKYGALDQFISNHTVEFMMKMFLARGVVRGLHYLHTFEPPVIHGYLKVQHVLVADDYSAKICDFGLSKWKTFATTRTMSRTQRGTVTHIPPENIVNVNQKLTLQYDIYSLGILLWQLLTGQQPFEQLIANPDSVMAAVKSNGRPDLDDVDKIEGEIPDDMRSEMKKVIGNCWAQEPDKRPSATELKAVFRGVLADKDELIKKARENLDKEILAADTESMKLQ